MCILQSPEIQTMYSLNMPVSNIRTKIRQEFERHRYVSQTKTVDVLLFNSHQEFQVGTTAYTLYGTTRVLTPRLKETMNYWKQLPHVLKYFRAEEDPSARLPKNFIQGFIEVSSKLPAPVPVKRLANPQDRAGTSRYSFLYIS